MLRTVARLDGSTGTYKMEQAGGRWHYFGGLGVLGTYAWDDICTFQMNMVGTSTWRKGLRGGTLGRSDSGGFSQWCLVLWTTG